jgi:hypothetical protein
LVTPNSRGSSVVPMLTESTHLLTILKVLSCSSAIMAATAMTERLSSSSPGGMETPPKKAHFRAFMRVSTQYVCGATFCLCGSCFSYFHPSTQKVISGWHESYLSNSNCSP